MSASIEHQVRELLYSDPRTPLSPEHLHTLNTLPIDPICRIIRDIYVTEPDRYVLGKTYTAILALQHLDTVAFFIDVLDELDADGRTTCCQTLGDFPDPR